MRNLLLLGFALVLPALAGKDKALLAYEQGNFAKAFREWQVLAEKGDVEAQFRLGAMFDKGEGTRPSAWRSHELVSHCRVPGTFEGTVR